MEREEAIRLLNEDIRGEHGAIILYLRIAYALRGGEMSSSIESIARDEMRHYKWLSQEVVRLGGTPTTEREEADGAATDPLSLMQLSISRETGAVEQYHAHAEAIGDPRIAALLKRIAQDEDVHHRKFLRFLEVMEAEGTPAVEEVPEPHVDDLPVEPPEEGEVQAQPPAEADAIQNDVEVEYTTLLQYLHQSFLTPHCPLGRDLEDQAIIEMKHMGWLAEYLADSGIEPHLDHGSIDENPDPEHILTTNIELEVDVEELYTRQMEATQDPKLAGLLKRILDHSIYHEIHFKDLLAEIQSRREASELPAADHAAGAGWTVGSLLGRRQE